MRACARGGLRAADQTRDHQLRHRERHSLVCALDAHPHPRALTVHDQWGNVIAELDATGATVREYIYLPEAEIAPTRDSRTTVDRPIAVVDAVNTTPVTLYVHADHLHRPVRMTNAAKATVWDVIWTPWGAPHTITGAQTLNVRFPGQWFQLEAGLHYNWHRHYDPTLGRYTQPDPLGFVDGPSLYAYARSAPHRYVDPDGRYFPGQSPPAAAAETLFLLILMMLPDQKPIPLPPPPPSPPEPEVKCTCSPETLDFMDMWVHRVCGWDNAFSCSGLNANEHGHVIMTCSTSSDHA